MAKFMLLVGGADLDKRSGSNKEMSRVMLERYMAWIDGLRAKGHYLSSNKLYDQTGTRLTMRGGQIVEGPFVETKEAVGGIFVLEAASLEETTKLARGCPVLELQNGYVEVRAIEEVRPASR